ncbi:Cocaine esterase [Phycisphaerae bacterium RAS1]|nr:Cocaine esterase [Phycisphaerae bacterium RAS1]
MFNRCIRIAKLGPLFGVGVAVVLAAVAIDVRAQSAPSPAASQATSSSRPAEGLPVPLAGFSDEGTFYLYKNEDRIITSKFKWEPSGRFEAINTLSMAGQNAEFKFKFTPDADGRFVRIDIEQPQGAATVEREGSLGRISFKEQKATVTFKPDTILFENFTPVFMTQAVQRYDRKAGGKQTFPVFIVGRVVIDASLEYTDTIERSVGGRDLKLDRYTYYFPGVDIHIWSDAGAKIYLADVPAQRAAYVREGYESLRKAPADDPLLSQPTFEVIEMRGAEIPMRDGLKLSADLYLPKTDKKVPVILTRTPYKKEMSELEGRFYARRGYAMAIQDCRGRFGSPGEWEPFVNEKQDGFDTIEWLAAQSWCDGKVGMIGGSYLGWVQWWALSQNPPHLVTIIPNVAPPDPFYNFPYEYGVFFVWGGIWWADIVEQNATGDLSGATISKIMEKKFGKLLMELPVIEADKRVLGKESKWWRTWIEHNTADTYWARASFHDSLTSARIPVFHQSGWFDGDGIGSKLNYAAMRKHGHPNQKLILGPWGHQVEASRALGDWDFGPQAAIDLPREYLRWFDHWLKGVDNGVGATEPLVKIFVMNSNVWLEGDTYPLPQTKLEKWYITSGGAANTSEGDGKLTREPPAADCKPDTYTYNPGDPTPMPSYREETEEEEKIERSQEEKIKIAKEYHEKVTAGRRDILVYTTEPFEKPYTFAGPMSATLHASTSARDTDWFVRLVMLDKGDAVQLAEGKIRARYRDSMSEPLLLEPGKTYEYTIDLWQTGITIRKGARLRVEIASASFPFFSRNLNTGGHNEKESEYIAAEQTVYHDAARPTHVLLPMIEMPEGEGEGESSE